MRVMLCLILVTALYTAPDISRCAIYLHAFPGCAVSCARSAKWSLLVSLIAILFCCSEASLHIDSCALSLKLFRGLRPMWCSLHGLRRARYRNSWASHYILLSLSSTRLLPVSRNEPQLICCDDLSVVLSAIGYLFSILANYALLTVS